MSRTLVLHPQSTSKYISIHSCVSPTPPHPYTPTPPLPHSPTPHSPLPSKRLIA
ncbi:MAG: hypothetical protein DSM106950_25105 [Stigonema ocellatum SAG 48.90 = DSM 106950]|nr:hypothetical protein [Stigonema ocellatum SAG 48.90 = DSM 106950]